MSRAARARAVVACLAVLLLAGPVLAAPAPEPDEDGRLVVRLREWREMPENAYGGRVALASPQLSFVAIEGPVAAIATKARADPNVVSVQRDVIAWPAYTPNDPYYEANKVAFDQVRAQEAWDLTLGDAAIKVAIIDSGLWREHEEYVGQARILQGIDLINGDADPAEEGCSHGTSTAGVVGAPIDNGKGIAGLAQVTILPIKIGRHDANVGYCTSYGSAFAQGFIHAADAGSHVASVSWLMGGNLSVVNDAIQYATDKGVIIVGAAGNPGPCDDCVQHPWRDNDRNTIIVSAYAQSYSAAGPQIDFTAPATFWAPAVYRTDTYTTPGGTSLATPVVAGTIALMKSRNASLTLADVERILAQTAVDVGPAGWDPKNGDGLVQMGPAVAASGGGNGTGPRFAATYSGVKGNAWWVEARVSANAPLAGVDARAGDGAWKPLTLRSWGAWAASFSIPDGSIVQLQARGAGGATNLSGCYQWTAAATVACVGGDGGDDGTPGGSVSFDHKGGNEWWIEVKVAGSVAPTAVYARDDGDAVWHALTLKSWGNWAGSFHIEPGHRVELRATSGAYDVAGCSFTHPGGLLADGSGVCTRAYGGDGGGGSFDATFRNVRGNEWWVQTDVSARGGTLAGVDARVDGGAWVALTKQSWGAWAKSIHAAPGSTVEFRARASDGQTDLSAKHVWPPA